jgi:hypothetical protein
MSYRTFKEHLVLWYEMFVNGGFGSAREFAEHQGIELGECERMLEIGRKYYNIKKQEDES